MNPADIHDGDRLIHVPTGKPAIAVLARHNLHGLKKWTPRMLLLVSEGPGQFRYVPAQECRP